MRCGEGARDNVLPQDAEVLLPLPPGEGWGEGKPEENFYGTESP